VKMSFDKHNEVVEEGDTVVLYFGRQNANPIEIKKTGTFQSKFGAFHHSDIIGKAYGSKLHSKKGWGYILRASPEIWTVSLPHRTQILYTMDISMITMELDLQPGSIVVESGTGSASLSHAMIRTIKPTGHLYTFDFHQNRVLKAREEFDQHFGVGKYVTCACADACVDGFSLVDKADAVFLDLPTPWDAISHAKRALKKSGGGRICSFSPCIEQVERTCAVLRQERFNEVKTVEVLVRSLCAQTTPVPELNFDTDLDKLEQELITSKKRKLAGDNTGTEVSEMSNDSSKAVENGVQEAEVVKENGVKSTNISAQNGSTDESSVTLVVKTVEIEDIASADSITLPTPAKTTGLNSLGMVTKHNESKKGNVNMVTCKATKEVTGHTGYLTFATLLPPFVTTLEAK